MKIHLLHRADLGPIKSAGLGGGVKSGAVQITEQPGAAGPGRQKLMARALAEEQAASDGVVSYAVACDSALDLQALNAQGEQATGEVAAVTCKSCMMSPEFAVTAVKQHPKNFPLNALQAIRAVCGGDAPAVFAAIDAAEDALAAAAT